MQIGMIGLGRMGANLVRRLTRENHTCVVYDVNPIAVDSLVGFGIQASHSLEDFISKLTQPRVVWIMVPAGVTGKTISDLAKLLSAGDIIVDGGNSYYRDDLERAKALKLLQIHYVDCGTSGGVFGLERGYCLMIGGEDSVIRYLDPIFKSLAPGLQAAPRTAERESSPRTEEYGYLHCGSNGAGHFVKMIHNGIEYGLMAAYAEGFNILKHANVGLHSRSNDAETTPLRDPEAYQYEIDVAKVAEVWRRGSVISSWLLDLTATALVEDSDLMQFSGQVSDSGEGRWTTLAAVDEGVPAPVISAALFGRFESRGKADYADRILSAMRNQFGGHIEKQSDNK
ncbi:MAG TPA: decarboxylating 6-phosphogluconate dehydrogenase [Nitrosomonas sp.]|nr:decarboxylating 6-phosphogluconate dehydrogenase [Nitrosomonas sp.]